MASDRSLNSVGATRPYTALALHCLRAKIKSISSTKLGTCTTRSWCVCPAALCPTLMIRARFSTALKGKSIRKAGAGVIRKRTLVSFLCFLIFIAPVAYEWELTWADREWYSCLNRYDGLFKS